MVCEQKYYAIREVSEITGIKPVTLRAWQRRYNLIKPRRTDKGHRLYTDADIELIRLIQGWLMKGVSIGKVGELLTSGETDIPEREASQLTECEPLLTALAALNRGRAESLIAQVMKEYPSDIAERQFILPVMETLEKLKSPQRSLQKALFHSIVLGRLSAILEAENKASDKSRMLCVSLDPAGSLLAWLWAVGQAREGYNVSFLDGADDLSGLIRHPSMDNFSRIGLFANRALSEYQTRLVGELQRITGERLICSEVLTRLSRGERSS